MNKTWLDIAGAVLDSVDTDCDIFSGGLNAAISTYADLIYSLCFKPGCKILFFITRQN